MASKNVVVKIKGIDVPCVGEPGINIENVINTFVPFKDWLSKVNSDPELIVKNIFFQSVDLAGSTGRVLFAKLKCLAFLSSESHPLPGIILLRGGSVTVLVELVVEGKSYALMVEQPRLASGKHNFLEAVAGMLDGSQNFVGMAAKELEEEAGIKISTNDMLDLTTLANGKESLGFYPSIGVADEFVRVFLYRVEMSREEYSKLEGKTTGEREHGEYIRLRIMALDDVWHSSVDSKALIAVLLREKLLAKGVIPPPKKK